MVCPECNGEGVIKLQDCQVTCQKCKGGKTVPTLDEWWALLDTVAVLKEKISELVGELADATGQTRAEIEEAFEVSA